MDIASAILSVVLYQNDLPTRPVHRSTSEYTSQTKCMKAISIEAAMLPESLIARTSNGAIVHWRGGTAIFTCTEK
jgi:hypothetical protein